MEKQGSDQSMGEELSQAISRIRQATVFLNTDGCKGKRCSLNWETFGGKSHGKSSIKTKFK